jgi:hypothetical protein
MPTDRRTRRLEAENATISTGEAVYAEIVEDLTWGELKKLQTDAPLSGAKYDDAAQAIARYVVGWNVEGRNAETGDMEPLPPPSVAGVDVFDAVEPWIISWLFVSLHTVHQGGDALRKKPIPIGRTADGESAAS